MNTTRGWQSRLVLLRTLARTFIQTLWQADLDFLYKPLVYVVRQ